MLHFQKLNVKRRRQKSVAERNATYLLYMWSFFLEDGTANEL